MKEDISKKRLFSLTGHAYSGKTSLTEAILFKAKAIKEMGTVEQANTASDYLQDERERKNSINASFFTFEYKNNLIQFVDVPGYVDFIGEVVSGCCAADFVIIVIDAETGIEVGTEKVWEIVKTKKIPCLFFINKLDQDSTDYQKTLNFVKDSLSKKAVPLVYPLGKGKDFKDVVNILDKEKVDSLQGQDKERVASFHAEIVENVAETDDSLLEKYLEKGALEYNEIVPAFKKAIADCKIFPVLGGSGTKTIGIDVLLEVILNMMPSPADLPAAKAKSEESQEVSIERNVEGSFTAQVVKTVFDDYVGQLSIFKVITGQLSSNASFYNASNQGKEKITHLYHLKGKEQKSIDQVYAGEIAAVTKLKNTHTGDTLSNDKERIIFEPIVFPEATFSASVKPKTRADEEKIAQALYKLALEDPTFKVSRDAQTKELVISGIGALHLKVIIERIKKRYGIDIELGKPKVPYKETITKSVKVQGRYKKQTGGHGQYGDVWIELEPLQRGKEFEFVNKIVGGKIPKGYIPSVEKGIRNHMKKGFLAGFPLCDVKVILYDGSYHPVDSSDMAFQKAGAMALKSGLAKAGSALLEPIMHVEISVSEDMMGQVTGDLSSRRGKVMGMEAKGHKEVVKALVPLESMFTYAADLKSMTGGHGAYSMSFSHYDVVPKKIADSIVERANQQKEEVKK